MAKLQVAHDHNRITEISDYILAHHPAPKGPNLMGVPRKEFENRWPGVTNGEIEKACSQALRKKLEKEGKI